MFEKPLKTRFERIQRTTSYLELRCINLSIKHDAYEEDKEDAKKSSQRAQDDLIFANMETNPYNAV